MSTATLEALSPQCDNGEHYKCKSTDCACICHEEDHDPEDDDN